MKILVFFMGLLMSMSALCETIRVATFNVSMEAGNYTNKGQQADPNKLFELLKDGRHPQIRNIAQIIQTVRPDIILLNEFDYQANEEVGVLAFIQNYLNQPQGGKEPINYPFVFSAPVNTGVDSGVDLNGNGKQNGDVGDAFGFGMYPGQYGMVLLSKFPIDEKAIRTFQHFLWKDMPNNLLSSIKNDDGKNWYSEQAQSIFRLSSKSHWDLPVRVSGQVINLLASHPTPPVFDGPEDRNGKRNHDEIRFWYDYITSGTKAQYIYDDKGNRGGLTGGRFAILGDLNASANEGDARRDMIAKLLFSDRVNDDAIPKSVGGANNNKDNPLAKHHTASWGMRADYVLPSTYGLNVLANGVFWPTQDQSDGLLVKDRNASSDHRLVWVDIEIDTLTHDK